MNHGESSALRIRMIATAALILVAGCAGDRSAPAGELERRGHVAWSLEDPLGEAPLDVAMSRDGNWVAIVEGNGQVVPRDAATGILKWNFVFASARGALW